MVAAPTAPTGNGAGPPAADGVMETPGAAPTAAAAVPSGAPHDRPGTTPVAAGTPPAAVASVANPAGGALDGGAAGAAAATAAAAAATPATPAALAALYKGRGNTHFAAGAYDQAIAAYTAGLDAEPRNVNLLSNRYVTGEERLASGEGAISRVCCRWADFWGETTALAFAHRHSGYRVFLRCVAYAAVCLRVPSDAPAFLSPTCALSALTMVRRPTALRRTSSCSIMPTQRPTAAPLLW